MALFAQSCWRKVIQSHLKSYKIHTRAHAHKDA